MCLTAIKKGWCANISKSEHICFTFAFYNEVLKIRKTSPCYRRSQPSSKKPWALQFRSTVVNANEFLRGCKCVVMEDS